MKDRFLSRWHSFEMTRCRSVLSGSAEAGAPRLLPHFQLKKNSSVISTEKISVPKTFGMGILKGEIYSPEIIFNPTIMIFCNNPT